MHRLRPVWENFWDCNAPGVAEYGAKTKRFALWLKSEMVNKGLAATGPDLDEGGWYINISSNSAGFVLCIVSGRGGDESLFKFELLVTKIGDAIEEDACDAIEHILRNASEITELKVD